MEKLRLSPCLDEKAVDLARVQRVLAIDHNAVYWLRKHLYPDGRPFLDVVGYGSGRLKRVLYRSLVEYCDYLRERYGIPDRRPRLDDPLLRHRDEDLLPFPLTDTIDTETARRATGYETTTPIRQMIEAGLFEAYRVLEANGSPWRISRSSFLRWLKKCHGDR
jgi:hypothetical protein